MHLNDLPAGGFLAIGPRYRGDVVADGNAVRFCHHGAPESVEVVPIEHVEDAPDPEAPPSAEVVD